MTRAALLLASALVASPAWAERTYGLVIGIDHYAHITDLHGAVNDARDIADALEGLGAEVTLLLDADANRERILSEWRRIATGLAPGDRFFVSYAGHGSNEPEAVPGSEADGRDENILLAGFAPKGPAAAERIRDDEIGELLALSKNAETIFVADACHSGTLSRDISPSLGYRYTSVREISDDPLPPPPPPSASDDEGREDATLFLAAVDETQKVPEFLIGGVPRGALSYAVAEGLRGAADANHDGKITKGELETQVRSSVRRVSEGLQRPQVSPAGEVDRLIVEANAPAPDNARLSGSFDVLPKIPFAHDGTSAMQRTFAPLDGTDIASSPETAELRYEAGTGRLLSTVGDTIRTIPPDSPARTRAEVQATIDKLRLVERLAAAPGPQEIRFLQGDGTYRDGDKVSIAIDHRSGPHLSLFDIASDGTIAFLYPRPDYGDPESLTPGAGFRLDLRVQAPFGSDHVVAVQSEAPLDALNARLARLDGTRDMRGLWSTLVETVPTADVAVFPFHSTGREAP